MVARGFSPWIKCEDALRRGATPESAPSNRFMTYRWHPSTRMKPQAIRASLRDAVHQIHANRGLKPTATLLLSLRDS